MKVAVAGTGYVGLVTGVTLASIGHQVTCVDVDKNKIELLKKGISPIYESGLEQMMKENSNRLEYTLDSHSAYSDADVIFIGVGTPENEDGSANLDYIYGVAKEIAESINRDAVVVIKSTVPVGTNKKIEDYINDQLVSNYKVYVASNPEFLAQGTAVYDTINAARIVIGVNDNYPKETLTQLYKPFTEPPYNIPFLVMNRESAEMVKYASNDFLALKISYINEIANLCEKVGADIEDVTLGMGYDSRIGNKFLNAGIGYGGSCFPKDTKALYSLSLELDSPLKTVQATIEVNESQKIKLIQKLKRFFNNDLNEKSVAVLGLTFKPETDDLRESPSIDNVRILIDYGVNVTVYDPIGTEKFKEIYGDKVSYATNLEDAISKKDAVFIITDWSEIKKIPFNSYLTMNNPVIFDGRNCYRINDIKNFNASSDVKIKYISIGREDVV